MNANASKNYKSFLQILMLVLGSVAGMALGGILVVITLMASPIVTLLILAFLVIYGIVLALSPGLSRKSAKAKISSTDRT